MSFFHRIASRLCRYQGRNISCQDVNILMASQLYKCSSTLFSLVRVNCNNVNWGFPLKYVWSRIWSGGESGRNVRRSREILCGHLMAAWQPLAVLLFPFFFCCFFGSRHDCGVELGSRILLMAINLPPPPKKNNACELCCIAM